MSQGAGERCSSSLPSQNLSFFEAIDPGSIEEQKPHTRSVVETCRRRALYIEFDSWTPWSPMTALTATRQPVAACRPAASTAQPMRSFSSSLATAPLVLQRTAPVQQRLRAFRPAVVAAAAPANQKIRIKLKSYWVDLLQDSVEKIREAAATTGATIAGPVPLPTRLVPFFWSSMLSVCLHAWLGDRPWERSLVICRLGNDDIWTVYSSSETSHSPSPSYSPPHRRRIYTVLRSPHVNKDSREQFELRTHQRLIDVKNLSSQTIDRLMQLDLPAGVDVEVKL